MADQMVAYGLKVDSTGAVAAFNDVGAAIQRAEDKTDKFGKELSELKKSITNAVASSDELSRASQSIVSGAEKKSKAIQKNAGDIDHLQKQYEKLTHVLEVYGAMKAMAWIRDSLSATLEFGAGLQDMSDRLGIATTDLQIFGNWAEMSGTDTETLAKAIAKLEVKLASGDRTLAKFGITATNGKDAFLQVVAAVEKAPTHFDKAKIASEAFGKSWADIMPVLDAGSENLSEMAQNAALISPESVQNLAKLDDRMAQLASTTRVFMAEAMAAFGPATAQLIEGMAIEIKNLNDYMTKESKDTFLSRVGGKQVDGSWVMGSDIDLKKLPSKDLTRLMEIRHDPNQNQDVIFPQQDDRYKRMHSVYSSVKKEEQLAAEKQLAAAKKIERDAADKRDADADGAKQEAQLDREIDFQRRIFDEIAILTATDDQRDLLRIKNKYENLRDEHANYVESLALIDAQYEAETQGFFMKKNFASLAIERDFDETQTSAPNRHSQSGWGSNDRARLARQMQNAGLIEDNGVGVYDATQMSIEEMQEALDNYRTAIDPAVVASITAASEMGDAWLRVADVFSDDMASRFAGAFLEMQRGTMSVSDAIKSTLVGSLESAEQAVLKLVAKYAILTAISAMTGGTATPLMGTGGLFDFVLSGLAGHADGTLSSPGGLRLLGERGGEKFETPYGQRGFANFGLYQVPAGTRVTKSEASTPGEARHYHLHTSESDPAQVVAIFERMVEQKISDYDSSSYRTRMS